MVHIPKLNVAGSIPVSRSNFSTTYGHLKITTPPESDEGESVEVHSLFSCSARVSWGTQEREATAPKARSCFSGGTRMGEPEPERRRQTKQKLRRPQGAGIWPEAVPRTEGQIRIMTSFLDASL